MSYGERPPRRGISTAARVHGAETHYPVFRVAPANGPAIKEGSS